MEVKRGAYHSTTACCNLHGLWALLEWLFVGLVPRKRCSQKQEKWAFCAGHLHCSQSSLFSSFSTSLGSELSLQELKKRNHLRVPGNERWSPYPEAKCLWALSAASWLSWMEIITSSITSALKDCITNYLYRLRRDYLIQDILKVHTKNLNSTHRTLMHAVDIVVWVYNAANWNNDTYLHAKSTKFLLP